jgi:hypothetical protein
MKGMGRHRCGTHQSVKQVENKYTVELGYNGMLSALVFWALA